MENEIEIEFIKEKRNIILDIKQPDLADLVHSIVGEHLFVSKENVKITTENVNFDKEEFLDLLIDVHEEFCDEINKFYENVEEEIKTYYKDEELSAHIINTIKGIYSNT